ncbi:hypothetical protein PSTG_19993, partial [Puccinia striiformis f. sp. tritici PST-78]
MAELQVGYDIGGVVVEGELVAVLVAGSFGETFNKSGEFCPEPPRIFKIPHHHPLTHQNRHTHHRTPPSTPPSPSIGCLRSNLPLRILGPKTLPGTIANSASPNALANASNLRDHAMDVAMNDDNDASSLPTRPKPATAAPLPHVLPGSLG